LAAQLNPEMQTTVHDQKVSLLIPIEAFDNFKAVKDFPVGGLPPNVLSDLVQKVKELDEREELEPWLRAVLADGARTPHGPAEIVDTSRTTSQHRDGTEWRPSS
jgi:hypothetical protein